MMNVRLSSLILVLTVLSLSPRALSYLEVDETITLRFLRFSDSQQTVLINRGLEDGLVVDMHAKFFLPTGIIARGKVIKASPSRSIWTLYRVLESEQLVEDRVVNAKISTPLMLIEDPGQKGVRIVDPDSRQRVRVGSSGSQRGRSSGIPTTVADTSQDLSADEAQELESFSTQTVSWSGTRGQELADRDWELWSLLHLDMLSGTYEAEFGDGPTSQSSLAFSLGIEKYLGSLGQFFDPISVSLLVSMRSSESGESVQVKSSWLEYGLGLQYHFYGDHWRSDNLIGYGALGLGVGSVSSAITSQELSGEIVENSLKGTSSFFSIGAGLKYYLSNGFGMRALFDYYRVGENYAFEDGDSLTRSLSGPRLQLGLSYRF
jgi:hypothetical protein